MYSTIHEVARATLRFADLLDSSSRRALFDPRNLLRAGLVAARHGAESIEGLLRGESGKVAFAELDNRLRVVRLFESVGPSLEPRSGKLEVAAAIAESEARLGAEKAIWASEGIGYELGRRLATAGGPWAPLPSIDPESPLPGSWGVLHTGVGMALAESFLADLHRDSEVGRAVAQHIESCRELARPGEAPMVFEPLGLVVRLLRPRLVSSVDAELRRLAGPWRELFWHGVGRGIYFLPADLTPRRSAPWRGWARCETEPPGPQSRRNARAGFAWALTLVNLETPRVMEVFLDHHSGGDEAIGNGISSALRFWELLTGGSRSQRRFVSHVATPPRRKLWRQFVSDPAATCQLETLEAWGDLYRYRD